MKRIQEHVQVARALPGALLALPGRPTTASDEATFLLSGRGFRTPGGPKSRADVLAESNRLKTRLLAVGDAQW